MLALLAIIGCLSLFAGFVMMAGAPEAGGFIYVAVGVVLLLIWSCIPAMAHDHNPEHDGWYASLMQADNPTASCCGVADAYWCDQISVKDGKTLCAITDDQDIPGRPKLPWGTKIEIPNNKLKWDRGNPTGHSIVFLSSGGAVYCFVQSGGV